MKTTSLNGTWKLSGRPQESDVQERIELDAQVPGCVQLELSREGYLPADLFMGDNILETEKYEGWEWWYERTFTAPAERENLFLVFEGVDCIAEYFINGERIGESENMFISHEFEVGKYLHDGDNTLTVHIKSPMVYLHNLDYEVCNFRQWWGGTVETGIRKPPHSFGWDIMPRAVTSGIWRDVRLEVRDKIRFSQLYARTAQDDVCLLYYDIDCNWRDFKNIEIEATGSCGEDSTFYHRTAIRDGKGKASIRDCRVGVLELKINNPKKWYPYGYGEPNVYDGVVRIYSDNVLVHEAELHFGIRTVELERSDKTDGVDGKFRFIINGVEIMCKGSNWVPLDVFHSRDAERYDAALALAKDVGCNILRCWGGNVYEDTKFFDFCDRNGIMVWQDFGMACRSYPQNERFKKLITEEVTAVIRKLRNHPSIIVWSGDNEVDFSTITFGVRPSENRITREWLPEVVRLNDIGRPFLPSSPYISDEVFDSKAYHLMPEDHLWGPRDYYKSDFYKYSKAHFISETGYHGCPALESIKKFITPERVWPYIDNPEWILHSTDLTGDPSRMMLMHNQVIRLFGEIPDSPEEFVIASQISQAEANKYLIERMRVNRPNKTGIIWWNLIDGWPQMSDAVVDYYFTKKLSYSYIKRSQAPFVIAVDELADGRFNIFACNDTLEVKNGHFTVKDAESDEILLSSHFTARENASTIIGSISQADSDNKMLIIEWTIGEESGFNHYMCIETPVSLQRYKDIMEKYNFNDN